MHRYTYTIFIYTHIYLYIYTHTYTGGRALTPIEEHILRAHRAVVAIDDVTGQLMACLKYSLSSAPQAQVYIIHLDTHRHTHGLP
jgi:hypothetical protein